MVEPGGGKPGHGPRVPHRPKAQCDGPQVRLPGTVEEKIDEIISQETGLSVELLDDCGGKALLTEMDNEQLLHLVVLDIHKAMEA